MISIDYPSTFEDGPVNLDGYTDTLPPGLGSGWIIDESFHDQWDLRLGSSLDLLDKAVGAPGRLDMFIHDSDHTYETMWFEFETAWPSLREGGILLADNVETNTSFFDFCRKVNRIPYILPADPDHLQPLESGIRVGLIIK